MLNALAAIYSTLHNVMKTYTASESVLARRLHSWPIDVLELSDNSIGLSNR